MTHIRRWRSAALAIFSLTLLTQTAAVTAQEAVPPDALPAAGPPMLVVFRVAWDAGSGYRFQETTPGLGINCVLDGQWAFQPERDEFVVRAGAAPQAAPAGAETTLAAGDCAILHQDVAREECNPGAGPIEFLTIALLPDETRPPANAPEALEVAPLSFLYAGNWSGTPDGPDGARHVTLHRRTLAPGAEDPASAVAGDILLILSAGAPLIERAVSFTREAPAPIEVGVQTQLAAGDSAHLQDGTTVTLRNEGDAPATFWLLALSPDAPLAPPRPAPQSENA